MRATVVVTHLRLLVAEPTPSVAHGGDHSLLHSRGAKMAQAERKHWKHLYAEIVATEICCGCSACIVACPHKVLELRDFDPLQNDGNSPSDNCVHGEEGCSLCAMACLRLGPALDVEPAVWGARRNDDQAEGAYRSKTLARATDPRVLA